MGEILLVTRPKYDDGTEYLSYYSSLIIKEAENKGVEVKDFEGKNVERGNVLKFVKSKNPSLLFINGHGNETALYGDNDKILFSLEDINLLKEKIIYARACNAGTKLGEEIVKGNDGCFIGYRYPFSFWIDGKHSATPAKDNLARFYLEPSNEIMNSLIKGRTTGEANEKSKKMMLENMREILKLEKKKEPGAMGMLKYLWNNFDGQVVLGNKGAIF